MPHETSFAELLPPDDHPSPDDGNAHIFGWSLLRAGTGARLAVALGISIVVWTAVAWALG